MKLREPQQVPKEIKTKRERERERSNNEIMDYRAHAIYIYSVRSKFMAGLLPNRGTYLGVNLVGIGIIKMSIPKISMYIDQTILLPMNNIRKILDV